MVDDPLFRAIAERDLVDGQHRNPDPARYPQWFTTAYFHRPEELVDEVRGAEARSCSARMKMHQDEVDIDAELVGRLVAEQFPELADLPISVFRSTGTVNAIYRIGDHLYARLPRMQQWAQDLDREWHWLPQLAPHLSLRVPEPVGKGHPTSSYPFAWAPRHSSVMGPFRASGPEFVHVTRQAAGGRPLRIQVSRAALSASLNCIPDCRQRSRTLSRHL